MEEQTTIACRLVGAEFAKRKDDITRELFAHSEETIELADGFAYRFSNDEAMAATIVRFIHLERTCCPFFRFEVDFEPHDGPIWLRLRGPDGIKSFIQTELGSTQPGG